MNWRNVLYSGLAALTLTEPTQDREYATFLDQSPPVTRYQDKQEKDDGRLSFYRGDDKKARAKFKENGIAPWEEPFLYLMDGGPFQKKYPTNWPMLQGRTPGGQYILYTDAGAKNLDQAKKEGRKHTKEWEALARALDQAHTLYESVLGKSDPRTVCRVYYFTDPSDQKPFELKIGAIVQGASGAMSSVQKIVYTVKQNHKEPLDITNTSASLAGPLHEASHHYFWEIMEDDIDRRDERYFLMPQWMNEGLAVYFERYKVNLKTGKLTPTPGIDKKGWADDKMQKILDKKAERSWEDLMTLDFNGFHEYRGDTYAQSAAIARYLLDDHGTNRYLSSVGGGRELFQNMLDGYKKGRKPGEKLEDFRKRIFDAVLGKGNKKIDVSKLEAEWKEFVRNGFK